MKNNHIILMSSLLVTVSAAYLKPTKTIPETWFKRNAVVEDEDTADNESEDQELEASERREDHEDVMDHEYYPGRVQIKVYRGPYDEHEHFAPHGFWVKQPADDRY